MWKTWPGTESTLSVRAVSSSWAVGRTLSARVSFYAQLAASPNTPEGLPIHCQNPQEPTRKESQECWGHPKGLMQQPASNKNNDFFFSQWEYIYTYILGLVMVDPWGSIVSKPEMFWEILGWSYFVFVVVSQLPTKDTVGILQMISRSFPECNSEWSNHIALECACFFVSMGTPPRVGWDPNDCLLPPFQWNLNFK